MSEGENVNKLVVYSQPGCAPCKASIGRIEREGIPHSVIDIREDEAALQRLQDAGYVGTPVFGWGGRLHSLDGLPAIIREAREQAA